jgi:hypothetical protein
VGPSLSPHHPVLRSTWSGCHRSGLPPLGQFPAQQLPGQHTQGAQQVAAAGGWGLAVASVESWRADRVAVQACVLLLSSYANHQPKMCLPACLPALIAGVGPAGGSAVLYTAWPRGAHPGGRLQPRGRPFCVSGS